MDRFFRSFFWMSLVIFACGLMGCATTPKADSDEHEKVSTLPWNQPQPWEKSAPLGGITTQ